MAGLILVCGIHVDEGETGIVTGRTPRSRSAMTKCCSEDVVGSADETLVRVWW